MMSRTETPSVYVSAAMDSYLEKKSSGVLRSKTRVRCQLHGSTLYEQKDQGDMKFINLGEAQIVRQVANDTTGVQFEIMIKKKTHTYICSSAEECKSWITALQESMALSSPRDLGSKSQFYHSDQLDEDSTNASVYSTINDTDPNPNLSSSSKEPVENHYCTPFDAVNKTENKSNHNDYEEVTLRRPSLNFDDKIVTSSQPVASDRENSVYSDGISSNDNNSSHYAEISKKKYDPVDALVMLEAALSDSDLPVEDLRYSLHSEDISCVRILKAYLQETKMYCPSIHIKDSNEEDPIANLKTCLSSLSIK